MRGRFTFDSAPQQVTMSVEAGAAPGSRVIRFDERWADGGNHISGSFLYNPG